MKNLKDKVKKEFESQIDTELDFDTTTLNPNPKSFQNKIIIRRSIIAAVSVVALCIISIPISIPILLMLDTKDTFKTYKKEYTQSELKQIELNTFKKLNDVSYPEQFSKREVSDEYRESVIDFSNKMYFAIDQNNAAFSPLNLYMNLSILSLASNNENTLKEFDNLLGMSKESREKDFINAYINDYFYNSSGTMQMYNGYFATNKFDANNDFISSLTRHYTEAYQVDFNSDASINKILSWIDQRVQDRNFLNKNDLEIDENTAILLISTLYYKNTWFHKFDKQDTIENVFYLEDRSTLTIPYLSHKYFGECYDYEDYISCYDYYVNGLKIKYIIPKTDVSKSIFELIHNKNIFVDDETRRIKPETSWYENPIINLKVPKFENECLVDFSSTLKANGLRSLFDPNSHSFDYAFDNLPSNMSIYLDYVKQKNHISFDESGTTLKSVTFSGFKGATSAAPMTTDTIDVNLNRPFVYIIYDSNDLPIFVGNLNNPIK